MANEKANDGDNDRAATAKDKVVPIDAIQDAIKGIKFGVIQLIIQDGRVIQLDKTEKIRLI